VNVRTENLSVRYNAIRALENVSLSAASGSVLAVVGPNGSGKSSLVKALAGVVKATGNVFFDERTARPNSIGYMAQDIGSGSTLTVLEVVLLGRLRQLGARVTPTDLSAVNAVLDELDLLPLASRSLRELSGGQRQTVFLAQALASDPAVLLLDEPISALDLRHQLEVMDLIARLTRDRALTTICVLHDLNMVARYADDVVLLDSGRVAARGKPTEVLTAAAIRRTFQVDANIQTLDDGSWVVVPIRPTPLAL